jgi:hypothetical protein
LQFGDKALIRQHSNNLDLQAYLWTAQASHDQTGVRRTVLSKHLSPYGCYHGCISPIDQIGCHLDHIAPVSTSCLKHTCQIGVNLAHLTSSIPWGYQLSTLVPGNLSSHIDRVARAYGMDIGGWLIHPAGLDFLKEWLRYHHIALLA